MAIYGYITLSNDVRQFHKHKMNKKHRQIGKQALEEIKREFNYYNNYCILASTAMKYINFDKVIKDRSYLKRKSRQEVCGGKYGNNIEQRCSGGRTYFMGWL